MTVLLYRQNEMGLDRDALAQAVQIVKFRPKLENMRKEAVRRRMTAAPTFIIEDRDRIVGAQPIEVFKKKLRHY